MNVFMDNAGSTNKNQYMMAATLEMKILDYFRISFMVAGHTKFDSGRIVRVWRETVTTKYSNLPGIRGLHDFFALYVTVDKTV